MDGGDSRRLTEQELDEIKRSFSRFDQNGDGRISVHELTRAAHTLGMNPTKKEAEEMIKEVDKNKNGYVEYNEYLAMMKTHYLSLAEEKESMREAFRYFDKDGNGYICVDELRHVLRSTGDPLTDDEVQAFMEEHDIDGDGKISYEEFVEAICQKI